MIEIILIVLISVKLAAMLKKKGQNVALFVALFVCLWIGGEVSGFAVGAVISELLGLRPLAGVDPDAFVIVLICGYFGAAGGGIAGYVIAKSSATLAPIDDEHRPDGRHVNHEDARGYMRQALEDASPADKPGR